MTITYCSLNDVKAYLTITDTSNDTLLTSLIEYATSEIETYTRRRFYATNETRYFNPILCVLNYRTLMLDEDLSTVITVTNGDGTVFSTSDYIVESPNYSPYWGITLKASSGKSWTWVTDPENSVSVNGSWGYNNGTIPPSNIKLAAIRIAVWRYKQKDAPFNTMSFPDQNMVIVPASIPADIARMLDQYVKPQVTSYYSGRAWY